MHLPRDSKLTFSYPVERGRQRFRELIVYISDRCKDDPDFGSVKLNKILYFSDFTAFERFGQPITGMTYQKLEHGPAPNALLPVRRELLEDGSIRLDDASSFGKPQKRTVALRTPVTDIFLEDELALVDSIIASLKGQNATDVSNRSHDYRWATVQLNDPIPYEAVYIDPSELTAEDVSRSHSLAEQFGWL